MPDEVVKSRFSREAIDEWEPVGRAPQRSEERRSSSAAPLVRGDAKGGGPQIMTDHLSVLASPLVSASGRRDTSDGLPPASRRRSAGLSFMSMREV